MYSSLLVFFDVLCVSTCYSCLPLLSCVVCGESLGLVQHRFMAVLCPIMLPHVASCCLMLPHVASCCFMLPQSAHQCLFFCLTLACRYFPVCLSRLYRASALVGAPCADTSGTWAAVALLPSAQTSARRCVTCNTRLVLFMGAFLLPLSLYLSLKGPPPSSILFLLFSLYSVANMHCPEDTSHCEQPLLVLRV